MAHFYVPGDKIQVPEEIMKLFKNYGLHCEKEEKPSEYIENGARIRWYKGEDGYMRTKILPIE
ncbi:hypothetical protein [Bacillus thuringiensis]|uniref:Uncharacterized protein n=1 Tax=Bacillus thuringiensis serovar andalousiensis TaxID=257985 RepID=A0A6H0TFP0_BACTU|nr:hypothetical protein [Bacillus thuringiensis]QIW18558.1 hypothetical protein EVG22_08810 [Bacillus thuringiensis serovar andalousiensis]